MRRVRTAVGASARGGCVDDCTGLSRSGDGTMRRILGRCHESASVVYDDRVQERVQAPWQPVPASLLHDAHAVPAPLPRLQETR